MDLPGVRPVAVAFVDKPKALQVKTVAKTEASPGFAQTTLSLSSNAAAATVPRKPRTLRELQEVASKVEYRMADFAIEGAVKFETAVKSLKGLEAGYTDPAKRKADAETPGTTLSGC